MTDTKILVFDMDGTIADLYGVDNWLADLRAETPRPYVNAKPLYNMNELANVLDTLKKYGWRIIVTSWLSKGSSTDYDIKVRRAKREWLEKYHFPADELHFVKYGTTKANCTRHKGGFQILIDDNEKVRKGWKLGATINAKENIIPELLKLLND